MRCWPVLYREVSDRDRAGRIGLRVRYLVVAALAALCMPLAHGASAPSEEYRGDTGSMAAREARSKLRSARSEPGGTVGSADSASGRTVRSAVSAPGRTVRLPPPAPGEGETDGNAAERFLAHRVGFGRDIAGLGVEVPDQGDLRWGSVPGSRRPRPPAAVTHTRGSPRLLEEAELRIANHRAALRRVAIGNIPNRPSPLARKTARSRSTTTSRPHVSRNPQSDRDIVFITRTTQASRRDATMSAIGLYAELS